MIEAEQGFEAEFWYNPGQQPNAKQLSVTDKDTTLSLNAVPFMKMLKRFCLLFCLEIKEFLQQSL